MKASEPSARGAVPSQAGAVPAVAIVPAYRPTPTLNDIVADLAAAGFRVVVVDDGSGPDAAPLFDLAAAHATVLQHPRNLGKGAALRTGLEWVGQHFPKDEVVVTVDADGQHRLGDVVRVCQVAAAEPESSRGVVLGARMDDASTPAASRIGHVLTRGAFRLATGRRLVDTQTGLRAFRADLIPFMLQVPGQRYEYEMNMLLRLARDRIRIDEVKIATVYDDQSGSHFRSIVDSLRIGRDLLAFSASSFVSFLVDYSLFTLGAIILGSLAVPHHVLAANIIARVGSASVNYTINKRIVFHSEGRVTRTAAQYAALVAAILAANTTLLGLLTGLAGVNPWLAKIGIELLFFAVSWTVQHRLIFADPSRRDRG